MFNNYNNKIYWISLEITLDQKDIKNKRKALFLLEEKQKQQEYFDLKTIENILECLYKDNEKIKDIIVLFKENKHYVIINNTSF